MKPDTKRISQLQQLVEIRKNERQLARNEVFQAGIAETRAETAVSQAKNFRDQALVDWHDCREADDIDLGLEPMVAQQLIAQEELLRQSDELLKLATERLDEKRALWKLSDLNLRTSQKISKQMERRVGRKKEEERLAELNDRHCYQQVQK